MLQPVPGDVQDMVDLLLHAVRTASIALPSDAGDAHGRSDASDVVGQRP